MNSHWMSRMLAPGSIAIVGASDKKGSMSQMTLKLIRDNGFQGQVYLVNPRYQDINGIACYPKLSDLPVVPDLVVMVVGSQRMEQMVSEAIALQIGGIVIYANNFIEDDDTPPLLGRLKNMVRKAGIPVCGGNGMGFYNYDAHTLVSFDYPPERPAGHIALIAHSGSVMTYLANTDPRLMFNLVVSPGQEINGSVADYMLYALSLPTTRVLAAFIETVRDPDKFVQALEDANTRNIPVVLVKVGATEKSARMAQTHSGAIAGQDTAFQAICEHYGVIRVCDMDELAATALAFSQENTLGSGKLSSLLDSGGLREQMIDLADKNNVEFTDLCDQSRSELEQVLEYGLIAENPVDAMGAINADVAESYTHCLNVLGNDPGTAMVSLEFEFRDGFSQYPQLLDVAKQFRLQSNKPFVIVNSTANVSNSIDALDLGSQGIPVLNGISPALCAIGNMFRYRDHRKYPSPETDVFSDAVISKWRAGLKSKKFLGEVESLKMLGDFGLSVAPFRVADTLKCVLESAEELSYPVVLKSADPTLQHKSDAGGVHLNLESAESVESAYIDLSQRLGPDVLVATMLQGGIELGLGVINDSQFGPMVMVCAGGIYIELLEDRKFIPAPCSLEEAEHHIKSLKIHKILRGARGKPECRIDLAAKMLSDLSLLAWAFKGEIREIDLNPVLVTPVTCSIADALVICQH